MTENALNEWRYVRAITYKCAKCRKTFNYWPVDETNEGGFGRWDPKFERQMEEMAEAWCMKTNVRKQKRIMDERMQEKAKCT